jgi:NitT/TauT family transport system permease protein
MISISLPEPVGRKLYAALSMLLLLLLWQFGYVLGGPFVLPAPLDAGQCLLQLASSGALWYPAITTTWHVVAGYALGCAAGLALGLAGGAARGLGMTLDSASRLILGVPPIVWVVLALFWFGPVGKVTIFTVAIGIAPIVFAGTLAGIRAAQPELDELAAAFNAPPAQRFREIRLPQIMTPLLPALTTSLGLAWKMALMAEILSDDSGIGGQIETTRSYLDITGTMAWVATELILLLLSDLLLGKLTSAFPMAGSPP